MKKIDQEKRERIINQAAGAGREVALKYWAELPEEELKNLESMDIKELNRAMADEAMECLNEADKGDDENLKWLSECLN